MTPPKNPRLPGHGLVLLAVALALQAPFLGGGTQSATRGLSLVFLAVGLIAWPPRRSLGLAAGLAFCALLAWSLAPLLPAVWLEPHPPAWRVQLGDFATDLPASLSPQPWLTAEGALLLAAGLAAFCWFAGLDLSERARRQAVRWYAWGMVALAGLCLAFYYAHVQPALWFNDRHFGPFPSRNHTGALLGTGAVVVGACAVESFRRHPVRAWGFVAGFALIVAALLANTSRGGLLALFVGAGTFLLRPGGLRRFRKAAALSLAGLILVAIFAALFGGDISARLAASGGGLGFRSLVYADTFAMIAHAPWIGVGLGNFEPLFPFFQDRSLGAAHLIHPESDWLWAAAEWGGIGLAFAALAAAAIAPRLRGTLWDSTKTLEQGALAALAGFVAQSGFDVPARLQGTAWPALLLLSFAVAPGGLPLISGWGRQLFRGAGLLIGLGGLYLLVAGGAWAPAWPARFTAEAAVIRARTALQQGDPQGALATASAGLRAAPLSWQLRFQRAVALLDAHRFEEAGAEFKVAKLLQPLRPELPALEGEHWLRYLPARALPAWREALALTPEQAPQRYERMVYLAKNQPGVLAGLRELAETRADLLPTALRLAEPAEFPPLLEEWRAHDPPLAELSEPDLRAVLKLWWVRDAGSLRPLLLADPRWAAAGWLLQAREWAEQKEFKKACLLARPHVAAPPWPPLLEIAPGELRRRMVNDPDDYASAYSLIRATEKSGDSGMAGFLAGRTAEQSGAPAYFSLLRADLAAGREDWPVAWNFLARYLDLQAKLSPP